MELSLLEDPRYETRVALLSPDHWPHLASSQNEQKTWNRGKEKTVEESINQGVGVCVRISVRVNSETRSLAS